MVESLQKGDKLSESVCEVITSDSYENDQPGFFQLTQTSNWMDLKIDYMALCIIHVTLLYPLFFKYPSGV